MHITMADHPIFQDVTITDSQLTFFGTVSTNGVTYISQWNNASTYTEIARPLSANGQSIFELPAGGTYNGTTLSSPLLCVGLSEYSLATLTTEGQKVLSNVCYYLAGKPIPSGINHLPLSLDSRPSTIYNLTGQRVSNSYKGIVICNGKKLIRK